MLEKSDSSLSHVLDMQLTFGDLLIDLARIVAHTANECTSKNVVCFFRKFADNSINFNIMYAGYYDSVFIFEDKPITIKQLIYFITILRNDNPYGEYYNINISAYLDNDFYYLFHYENEKLFQAYRIPELCIEQVHMLYQDNTGNNMVTFRPVDISLFSYIRGYKVQPRKDN